MQELSGVSEVARELAMSRFRLIQPHLEENRPLHLVATDGKLPFQTAQHWVSQYRKFGLIASVRKSRDDRGAHSVVSPKIKAAIEALALESPPLPVRSICRKVRQFAGATGEPLPRYGTVYDLVRQVPVGLLIAGRRRSAVSAKSHAVVSDTSATTKQTARWVCGSDEACGTPK
jgi:putative transposase